MRGKARIIMIRALAVMNSLAAFIHAEVSVEVTGNKFFSARQIKEVLTPEPEAYDKNGLLSWQEDAQFYAADLYRKSGFFDAKVNVDLRPSNGGDKKEWAAKLQIEEGVQYTFDSVRVLLVDTSVNEAPPTTSDPVGLANSIPLKVDDSPTILKDSSQANMVTIPSKPTSPQNILVLEPGDLVAKVGKPYEEDLIFQDRRFLLQRFGNSGYVRATVDDKVTVKASSKTVQVDYLVAASYPVLFSNMVIRNQRGGAADTMQGITRDELLLSLVPYRKGDTVRISDNDRLLEKLQYTGAFNFARLKDSLLPGPEHTSALVLLLEERVPGNLRTSIFYENYSGFGISADARHSNFAGTLNEIRGGGALATLRQNTYVGFGSPLTLGYLVRFDNDFSVNWHQDQPVHYKGTDSALGLFGGDFRTVNSTRLTWPWSYWLRLVGNAELESKSRMLGPTSRERSLNINFIQTAYFSFLNQALDPSRGVRFAPSWGNGGPLIEDREFRFTKFRHNWLELQTGYYYYHPAFDQIKVAMRLDGGRFFGRGGTNTDRFFLGGSRSVRSYAFRELCPETETSIAGNDTVSVCATKDQTIAYFLSSYELRLGLFNFPMIGPKNPLRHFKPLEVVPFLDFGKAWDVEDGFALSGGEDTAHQPNGQGTAVGFGFRYPLLGIFNFRLDFAWGRPGNGKSLDAWIIDLAQSF